MYIETPIEFQPEKLDQFEVNPDSLATTDNNIFAAASNLVAYYKEYFFEPEVKTIEPTTEQLDRLLEYIGDEAFTLLTCGNQDWVEIFNKTKDPMNIPTQPMVLTEMRVKNDKFSNEVDMLASDEQSLSFVTHICNKALIIDLLNSPFIGNYVSLRFVTSETFQYMQAHSSYRNYKRNRAPYHENSEEIQPGTFNFLKFAQVLAAEIQNYSYIALIPSTHKRSKLYRRLFPKSRYPNMLILEKILED